jgi:2-hydroxy-3-oxopropionate reductase
VDISSASVIGLGPMGHPVAANLLAALPQLTVWNRTASRGDDLVAAGAQRAATPADAAAPVILSVLPDVRQLRELLDAPTRAAWAEAGAHLIVLSTTGPAEITALAEELGAEGIRVIDAPVSGGVAGAAAGMLSIMVGAEAEDLAVVRPVLEAIGTTIVHLGPVGSGAIGKLCNQVVVAGTLGALAEALGLARRSGLDPQQVVTLLEGGLARSEVLAQKREQLLSRQYPLGGSLDNQVKDLNYATAAAAEQGLAARLLPVLLEMSQEAVGQGHGQDDHSVLQELYLD